MRNLLIIITLLFVSTAFAGPVDLDYTDDIRPLKGPVEIKEGFPVWPLVILVLLALAAFLVFIYFKKRRHVDEKPLEPPRPPEEIFTEKLNLLLEKRLVEKGMVKEYYIELSDIIRGYIEARFRVFALDRTTWELYQEMRSKKLQRAHVDKIRDFLEDCDLVKFAKYIPTQKEAEEAYNKAKEIIALTTPVTIMTNNKAQNPK